MQCRQCRRNFQELQDYRLVGAQHLARCDTKCKLIADLTGSAGDSDANGVFHCALTFVGSVVSGCISVRCQHADEGALDRFRTAGLNQDKAQFAGNAKSFSRIGIPLFVAGIWQALPGTQGISYSGTPNPGLASKSASSSFLASVTHAALFKCLDTLPPGNG